MRHTFAVAVLLAAAGSGFAKPPGLTDPRVEGREPPPVIRDHYEVAATPACGPAAPPTMSSESFWAALRRALPALFAR